MDSESDLYGEDDEWLRVSTLDVNRTIVPSAVAKPPPPRPPPPSPKYLKTSPPPPPTLYTPLKRQRIYQLPPGHIGRPTMLSSIVTGCPATYLVTKQGAKGDGTTDNSAAFLAAVAASYPILYLPPGVFRISRSITINKPLVAGLGTSISVDSGVTLTLGSQAYRQPRTGNPFFVGAGRVTFSKSVEVHPDWWMANGYADSTGLQLAGDSCGAACNVILTRIFYIVNAWRVNPKNGVFGTAFSMLVALGSASQGVIFRPGTYTRPFVVPSVRHFDDWCIKVQGGVTGVNIQVGTLSYCEQGLVFDTTTSSGTAIRSAVLGHVSAAQTNRYTVVFRTGGSGHLISGCSVRINFALTPGFTAPAASSSVVDFQGAPATFQNNVITLQAYDPAQPVLATRAVLLSNGMAAPAPNVQISVDTWLGGLVAPGRIVTGAYRRLGALLNVAGGMTASTYFAMTADSASFVSLGTYGSAGTQTALSTSQALSAFNGGAPTLSNMNWYYATVTSNWPAGAKRTFYLYSVFMQTGVTPAQMRCQYARWGNPGVVCVALNTLNSQSNGLVRMG